MSLRAAVMTVLAFTMGCGTTRQQLATEQMLASDAVDRSVAQLDLTPLVGKKVYFDTQYIRAVKGAGFVNSDYIISSLRQQMFAFGCRLQDNREDAEVIIEGRVGVLGIDDHEITYGLPASNSLSTAASVAGTQLPLPALPELSVAKKNEQIGAAKVALFAYDRESREPIWQSGVNTAMSDSDAFWVFGAGPFKRGTIYRGMQLAGSRVRIPQLIRTKEHAQSTVALAGYQEPVDFAEQPPAPIRQAAEAAEDAAAEAARELERATNDTPRNPTIVTLGDEIEPVTPSATEQPKPKPKPKSKTGAAEPAATLPKNKPAEAIPAEAIPAEAKPAEAKPAEAKPAEAKPAEAKPAEAKPAENKSADGTKPGDKKSPPKTDPPKEGSS